MALGDANSGRNAIGVSTNSIPGYLPIEQPANFELLINLNAPTRLASQFQPSLVLRADRVIE